MNAAQLVDRVAATRPRAVELAETVSFAVLVEPALLRQARLQFMPDTDAGVEADLWLSPLVKSRSTEGITFFPEVAAQLRERIARNAQRSDDAWKLTSTERHKFLPPTLVLEERINHLSIDESEEAAREIDALLSSVLATMAAGGRDGLASWAARALANFPTSMRRRSAKKMQMIAAGASLRLGFDPRSAIGGAMPDWLRFVAPAELPVETVGVQLAPGTLRVDASKQPAGQLLRLPATRPYLLDLSWIDASGSMQLRQLALRAGETRNVVVGGNEVRLRTVAGDTYEVRLGGTAPADVRHHIIDFSHILARANGQYNLTEFSGGLTLLTAPPGGGKTHTLASLCRQWTAAGMACAYHFFESGTPKLEYWEFAERSLIAQLMTRYDAPPWAVTMRLPDVLRMIAPSVGTGPVYIVLDNVDVVQRHYTVSDVLGPLTNLPPQFAIVASATASAELRVNIEVRVMELKAVRSSDMPELPLKGTPERRHLEAVAVARAPLAISDNERLLAITELTTPRIDPWTLLIPHLGQMNITMFDERRRSLILGQVDDLARAHRDLAEALVSADTITWYRIRHAAWHWLHAGHEERAREVLATTEWLEQSIKLFGASITADIMDEVRDATVRHVTA